MYFAPFANPKSVTAVKVELQANLLRGIKLFPDFSDALVEVKLILAGPTPDFKAVRFCQPVEVVREIVAANDRLNITVRLTAKEGSKTVNGAIEEQPGAQIAAMDVDQFKAIGERGLQKRVAFRKGITVGEDSEWVEVAKARTVDPAAVAKNELVAFAGAII